MDNFVIFGNTNPLNIRMKSFLNLIIALGCLSAAAQSAPDDELFARITPDGFQITGDRQKLGDEISGLISEKDANFEYSVIKGKTSGDRAETYFAVLLRDPKRNITVARWLEPRDSGLYLVRSFANDNYWQVMTTACTGDSGCEPIVSVINANRQWNCGTPIEGKECKKTSAMTMYDR